jgi:Protein of unknown function (DUF2934)
MPASSSALEAISEDLRQKIQERAYAIWEGQGKLHGCDCEHWLQAEAEIKALANANATSNPSEGGHAGSAETKVATP